MEAVYMRQIPLSQSGFARVDDEDYARLAGFRWCYRREKNQRQGYAVRHVKVDDNDRLSYLHREIMNPPPDHQVIFRNYDTLDCRRGNLLVVTKEQARQHHRVRKDSKS